LQPVTHGTSLASHQAALDQAPAHQAGTGVVPRESKTLVPETGRESFYYEKFGYTGGEAAGISKFFNL
jgi:hypothetical protein